MALEQQDIAAAECIITSSKSAYSAAVALIKRHKAGGGSRHVIPVQTRYKHAKQEFAKCTDAF